MDIKFGGGEENCFSNFGGVRIFLESCLGIRKNVCFSENPLTASLLLWCKPHVSPDVAALG